MHVQVESWHPCPHIPGCIVINVGDSLQAWSDGVLKSNFHRVRMPAPGEPTVCPLCPPRHFNPDPIPNGTGHLARLSLRTADYRLRARALASACSCDLLCKPPFAETSASPTCMAILLPCPEVPTAEPLR